MMKYWYDLIYNPSLIIDESGLNDGTDIMEFVVLFTMILGV